MTPCEGEAKPTGGRSTGDPLTKDLLEAIIIAQEKSKLPVNPQGIQELARFAQIGTVALPGSPPTPNSTASSARAKISRAAPATYARGADHRRGQQEDR